jgi:hypothetical protein
MNKPSYLDAGLPSKIKVSKEFFNLLNASDDFELHKTLVRRKLLVAVNPKSGIKYLNPEIFRPGKT